MNVIETMKRALEALELVDEGAYSKVTYNLRAAIKQMEKVEPSVWISGTLHDTTFNPNVAKRWKVDGHAVRGYYAHPAPVAPEGWQLVPIEPTDEMLWQICPASADLHEWEGNYKAMLAAAPEYKP